MVRMSSVVDVQYKTFLNKKEKFEQYHSSNSGDY